VEYRGKEICLGYYVVVVVVVFAGRGGDYSILNYTTIIILKVKDSFQSKEMIS
jgi:hypothetical protein